MCIVFSIIECVYRYLMVILSSMIVGESSYVSFLRPSILCIHFVIFPWEWDEWPSPRSFGLLSLPSLHSLLMWLNSMFDLSWSSLFFAYSLFCYYPPHCSWFVPFTFSPMIFSYIDLFQVWYFPYIILVYLIISLICLIVSLLILYSHWAPLGPWLTNFSIHVTFYTWGHGFWSLDIWA